MRPLLLILLLIISFKLIAQTDHLAKNSFGVSVGVNQVKEENLHPKVHKGAVYSLNYRRGKSKKNYSYFDFIFQYSKIKTVFEEAPVSMNIQVGARYGYLFECLKKDKLSFYLGPNLSSGYSLNFYSKWDDSHLYWADHLSLGVANKLNYALSDKTALSFDLNYTLFSFFSRPEIDRAYKIDDVSFGGIIKNLNSDFEAGTLNKSFVLHFQTTYQFKLSEKLTEAISYSFNYSSIKAKGGMSYTNIQHNLGLKIHF